MESANDAELKEVAPASPSPYIHSFHNSSKAFKLLDLDGDGVIYAEELTAVIRKVIGGGGEVVT